MSWHSNRSVIHDALTDAMDIKGLNLGPGLIEERSGGGEGETWFRITGTWRLYARFLAAVAARDAQTSYILDLNMATQEAGSGFTHFYFVGCQLFDSGGESGAGKR